MPTNLQTWLGCMLQNRIMQLERGAGIVAAVRGGHFGLWFVHIVAKTFEIDGPDGSGDLGDAPRYAA